MPDYAGAVAAIHAFYKATWTATPVICQNEKPPQQPWPPVAGNGAPSPWVYLETITVSDGQSDYPYAFSSPGKQVWLTKGIISISVFTPVDTEASLGLGYAVQSGEIFRAKLLYNDTPGFYVRTWGPRVDGGGRDAEDGNWYRITAMVPFEYWHRA